MSDWSAALREAATWTGAVMLALSGHVALGWAIETHRAADETPLALMQFIELAPVMEFAEAEVEAPPPVEPERVKTPEPEPQQAQAPEPEEVAATPTVEESTVPPVQTVESKTEEKPAPPRRKPPVKPAKTPRKDTVQKTQKQTTTTRTSQMGAPRAMSAQQARAAVAPKVDPSRWHGSVRSAVARQAKRVRGQGTVTVNFVVNNSGAIVAARIARSSGNSSLDQSALSAVRSARAPSPPKGVAGSNHNFSIPLTFR